MSPRPLFGLQQEPQDPLSRDLREKLEIQTGQAAGGEGADNSSQSRPGSLVQALVSYRLLSELGCLEDVCVVGGGWNSSPDVNHSGVKL